MHMQQHRQLDITHVHDSRDAVLPQGARLVDIALEDGSAWSGDGFNHIKPSFEDNTVHFIGLLSDGGAPSGSMPAPTVLSTYVRSLSDDVNMLRHFVKTPRLL